MDVDFSGTWHNQHASLMELSVGADGRVAGTFASGVGCPRPSEHFPLVGFVCGDLITFSVSFGAHRSMTAWVGQHTAEDGVERIDTLWHMVVDIDDAEEAAWLWSGVRSGADTFVRERAATGVKPSRMATSHPRHKSARLK
jgi:avidin family protein